MSAPVTLDGLKQFAHWMTTAMANGQSVTQAQLQAWVESNTVAGQLTLPQADGRRGVVPEETQRAFELFAKDPVAFNTISTLDPELSELGRWTPADAMRLRQLAENPSGWTGGLFWNVDHVLHTARENFALAMSQDGRNPNPAWLDPKNYANDPQALYWQWARHFNVDLPAGGQAPSSPIPDDSMAANARGLLAPEAYPSAAAGTPEQSFFTGANDARSRARALAQAAQNQDYQAFQAELLQAVQALRLDASQAALLQQQYSRLADAVAQQRVANQAVQTEGEILNVLLQNLGGQPRNAVAPLATDPLLGAMGMGNSSLDQLLGDLGLGNLFGSSTQAVPQAPSGQPVRPSGTRFGQDLNLAPAPVPAPAAPPPPAAETPAPTQPPATETPTTETPVSQPLPAQLSPAFTATGQWPGLTGAFALGLPTALATRWAGGRTGWVLPLISGVVSGTVGYGLSQAFFGQPRTESQSPSPWVGATTGVTAAGLSALTLDGLKPGLTWKGIPLVLPLAAAAAGLGYWLGQGPLPRFFSWAFPPRTAAPAQ